MRHFILVFCAYTFILWHQLTGGLRRRWASKPLNTFTEALEAFRTAMSFRFIDWLNLNRDVFASYKASLGYIWAWFLLRGGSNFTISECVYESMAALFEPSQLQSPQPHGAIKLLCPQSTDLCPNVLRALAKAISASLCRRNTLVNARSEHVVGSVLPGRSVSNLGRTLH